MFEGGIIVPILKSSVFISFMLVLLLFSGTTAQGQNAVGLTGFNDSKPFIHLFVDGAEVNPENAPAQLSSGRTFISLPALQNIFPCQNEWGAEGELVLIGEGKRIQLFPGKNEMLINSLPQTLETAPYQSDDGSLILPLRAVGEALDYTVIYDEVSHSVHLNSPGYQPLPQAVPIPNQPTIIVDYKALPTWGNVLSVAGLAEMWKGEQIITGYFTRLVDTSPGRTTNVVLSSAKVNGTILQPGEVFSFNRTVGPRTAQGGYQNAKIFAGKKVVTGIGGGVCQTSSTLYNLALEAGLQVLERYPHSLKVVYAPPQRDATVSWGGADLKFRNTLSTPVKILCQVDNGYVFAAMVKAEPISPAAAVSSQ